MGMNYPVHFDLEQCVHEASAFGVWLRFVLGKMFDRKPQSFLQLVFFYFFYMSVSIALKRLNGNYTV